MLPTNPQSYPLSDATLNSQLVAWQQDQATEATFTQQVTLQRPWLNPPATVEATAEYRFTRTGDEVAIQGGFDGFLMPLDRPVLLRPATVEKPWGREIWFTGMEARGESAVAGDAGSMPLSSYLTLAPDRLCKNHPIVLLKILDPHPQPVLGDLYFEVHDQKREVYVVTGVDAGAWPDGEGEMRLGISPERRAEFPDDAAFRAAYLAAVKDYEKIRRAIDAGETVDPALEADKRHAMETFTAIRRLTVGEVVTVPTWMPHSLQHGVRVVEFQTPSFERFIISFAQQVLTQDHWDSEHAIAHMCLQPAPPPTTITESAPGITEIGAFDDFSVWRIELAPGAKCQPPLSLPYAVCMNVASGVHVNNQALAAEQACFVPNAALPLTLTNPTAQVSVSLVAAASW